MIKNVRQKSRFKKLSTTFIELIISKIHLYRRKKNQEKI